MTLCFKMILKICSILILLVLEAWNAEDEKGFYERISV